jgi:hypothetical protein
MVGSLVGSVVGGVEVSSALAIDRILLLWGECEEEQVRKSQPACAAA